MDICTGFIAQKGVSLQQGMAASSLAPSEAQGFIPVACRRLMNPIDVSHLSAAQSITLQNTRSALQHLIPDLVDFLKSHEQPLDTLLILHRQGSTQKS